MDKQLLEMTLEELWKLFPISLTEHKKYWNSWYEEEEKYLLSLILASVKIYHIGSTAVPKIWAKPIIDILVEADINVFQTIKEQLVNNGYICMADSEHQIDFNKGYTLKGFAERVFHLHLKEYGNNDELYFRDFLNEHADVAKQYERMKLLLWKKHEYNRDAYTKSKTEFIQKYTQIAKEDYGKRY